MSTKFSRVFAIIKDINAAGADVTYKELVKGFTNGETDSLSKIDKNGMLQEFIDNLMRLQGQKPLSDADYLNDPRNATRRAIIAQFKAIGRTTEDAIAWAEKYGLKNQNKKAFNDYTNSELMRLLQNAKNVKADFISAVNKQL